jgi:hypothetical protein
MARLALLFALLALSAVGCGGNGDSSGGGTTTSTTPAGKELPAPVAEKKEAVVSAAKALDYDRLETLLDPKNFSYSFGESGKPVAYWRRLEKKSHVPILGDHLPTVFASPHALRGDVYVWPSLHGEPPSEWTAEERQWLRSRYSREEIRQFEKAGGYLGYRAGIRKDGTWLFFVGGD